MKKYFVVYYTSRRPSFFKTSFVEGEDPITALRKFVNNKEYIIAASLYESQEDFLQGNSPLAHYERERTFVYL